MIFFGGARRKEKVKETEDGNRRDSGRERERERYSISNDFQLHHDCRWGLGTTVPVPLMPLRAAGASGPRCQFTDNSRCADISIRMSYKSNNLRKPCPDFNFL